MKAQLISLKADIQKEGERLYKQRRNTVFMALNYMQDKDAFKKIDNAMRDLRFMISDIDYLLINL